MNVVIVASGDLAPGDEASLAEADLVIAADGGAHALDRLGRPPELLAGDLDSVEPALVERLAGGRTRVERHPVDKEASDTALAVRAALSAGATRIVLIGAMGGDRLDHAVANLLLLADPTLAGIDVRLVSGASRVRLLNGAGLARLEGGVGDLVTLLPLGDAATGVTTSGLRWPLDDAELPAGGTRGLSNEVTEPPASVGLRGGRLLVFEHRTTHRKEPSS